jgi:hypothetical protein
MTASASRTRRSRVGTALGLVTLLVSAGFVPGPVAPARATASGAGSSGSAAGNLSAAIGRLVTLVGAAGGGLLALVWARVALSWFSNDVGKKVQAKDRARDALVGTLIFVAAISGLFWALAQWVVTGG